MDRFGRFFKNSTLSEFLRILLALALILVAGARDIRNGTWPLTLPFLGAAFVAAYAWRNFLVTRMPATGYALNVALFIGLVALFIGRRSFAGGPEPWPMTAAFLAFLGFYLGSFFFLLSDARIVRER